MFNLLALLYPPPPSSPGFEIELLLLCAQRSLQPEQIERVRQLARSGLDWDQFIAFSVNHKVYPLVYWNLHKHASGLVPERVLIGLQSIFAETVMANQKVKTEFSRVLKAFDEEQIDVLPLRGLTVAYLLYDELGLREFKDLDILVHKTNFERAEAVLLAMGYFREAPIEDNAYNQKLYNNDLEIEIELHWGVDTPFMPVDAVEETYWQHTSEYAVDGINLRVFRPEDFLLLLATHGAKHRWHRLKWLCDIHQFVLRYPDFDWGRLLHRSKETRIERIILLNLWMSHLLFGTELAPVVRTAVEADPVIPLLGRYIRQWLFDQSEKRAIDQLRAIGYFLFVRERSQDRVFSIQHALQYPKAPIFKAILGLPGARRLIETLVSRAVSSAG